MSLYPKPSPRHAEPTLQPSYFTSSLYTEALRQDIAALVSLFQGQRVANPTEPAFPAFKRVWREQKWHFLHLRVFDDRSRESYLLNTCRMFLETTKTHEPLFTRATGTLALYTFYSTQPLDTTPALWNLKHIPIPLDELSDLENLDKALEASELDSLRPTVTYIMQHFRRNNIFLLLPHSSLSPHNPRTLPREIYVDQGRVAFSDTSTGKKKGRPTRNDKTRKTKSTMDTLGHWLGNTEHLVTPSPSSPSASSTPSSAQTGNSKLEEYSLSKARLLQSIASESPESTGHVAIQRANELILQRLKDVRNFVPDDNEAVDGPAEAGIGRVELAVEDMKQGVNKGVLNLLDGSGRRS